jgi:hypothetical protein
LVRFVGETKALNPALVAGKSPNQIQSGGFSSMGSRSQSRVTTAHNAIPKVEISEQEIESI